MCIQIFATWNQVSGLKASLLKAGLTVESITSKGPDAVSTALGIEAYVAKLIYDEAKKITAESVCTLTSVLFISCSC